MNFQKHLIIITAWVFFFFILSPCFGQDLSKETIKKLKAAKSVHLIVEQTYEKAENFSLPLEKTIGKLLTHAGLSMAPNSENANFTLKITVKGVPLSRKYMRVGQGYETHYAGAKIDGSILFQIQGQTLCQIPFSGIDEPVRRLAANFFRPESAPFKLVLFHECGFFNKLFASLIEIYGPGFFAELMKDKEEYDLRKRAVDYYLETSVVYRSLGLKPLFVTLSPTETSAEGLIKKFDKIDPKWKKSEAGQQLIRRFEAELKQKNLAAASVLGKIADPGSVKPLIKALKYGYSKPDFFRAVAHSLKKIGDPRAIEPLIRSLSIRSKRIETTLRFVLKELTGQDFGTDAKKWRTWWKQNKNQYIK